MQHSTILQTALDLLARGHAVYVLSDCIASRPGREADFDSAIQQLEAAGCTISTAETALLQLVGDTKAGHFGEIGEMLELEGEGGDPEDEEDEEDSSDGTQN
eukprot:SAG31_NODE_11354_length_1039_cov_1.720213_2_plen_102_part_00